MDRRCGGREAHSMKMAAETIANIKKIAEDMNLSDPYESVGIRVQEQEFEAGKIDHGSHVWDDGDDTGVELDGICACELSHLGDSQYFGNHAAIICGNSVSWG